MTFEARDDKSGIAPSPCYTSGLVFVSPSGNQQVKANYCDFTLISGTVKDGTFETTLTFPQYIEEGTWTFKSMILEDNAGNVNYIYAAQVSATVEVTYQ